MKVLLIYSSCILPKPSLHIPIPPNLVRLPHSIFHIRHTRKELWTISLVEVVELPKFMKCFLPPNSLSDRVDQCSAIMTEVMRPFDLI